MPMIEIGNVEIAIDVLSKVDRENEAAGPMRNAAVSDWVGDILSCLGAERGVKVGVDEQRHGVWDRDDEQYADGVKYHACGVVCSWGVS